MVKEIYLLFKTHLDIGFTNNASVVVKRYLEEFIPNAIKVGYELKNTETPFIWTVGSWLLNEALKDDKDGRVEKAIREGVISWHGLPFTGYTEMMNETLFEYGLSLADKLDERFGKQTISAKMTDVPGHTVGMIKHLKAHGIEFMHIGVNEATPLPPVPPLFKWSDGENEITVMYESAYGGTTEFGDFAVTFGFTGDNCGPQNPDVIVEQYKKLQEKYPEAKIIPATLNDVALRMRRVKDLPVINKEIGDTWIHGLGTDPKKVSIYRSLLRHIEEKGTGDADLSDNLLLVPEHTWGADRKCRFKNEEGYTVEEFEKLRDNPDRKSIEETWAEQRAYLDKAQEVLGTKVEYCTEKPDVSKMKPCEVSDRNVEISWVLYDSNDIIGSPLICGIDKGVRNGEVEIQSLDAPLVCPFGRRLLEYDLHPSTEDMYFNLYNNIWNTNHPLWYEEDSVFRFVINS